MTDAAASLPQLSLPPPPRKRRSPPAAEYTGLPLTDHLYHSSRDPLPSRRSPAAAAAAAAAALPSRSESNRRQNHFESITVMRHLGSDRLGKPVGQYDQACRLLALA